MSFEDQNPLDRKQRYVESRSMEEAFLSDERMRELVEQERLLNEQLAEVRGDIEMRAHEIQAELESIKE